MDPEHRSYRSFASFSDPDGNGWLFQEITARLPGRVERRHDLHIVERTCVGAPACGGRARRAREADRQAGCGLAGLVCRVHRPRAGRQGAAVMSGGRATRASVAKNPQRRASSIGGHAENVEGFSMRSDMVPGAVFPDYELSDHTAKRRKLSELQGPASHGSRAQPRKLLPEGPPAGRRAGPAPPRDGGRLLPAGHDQHRQYHRDQ